VLALTANPLSRIVAWLSRRAPPEPQDKYAALFEHSPAPMALVDARGAVLEVNPAWERLTGWRASDARGRSAVQIGLPEARGPVEEYPERLRRADGCAIDVLMSARDVEVAGARGVVWSCVDVTAHRLAERALRASEARLRALTELSADWYWEQDEQFRFVWHSGSELRPAQQRPRRYIGLTRWEAHADSLTPQQWAAHRAQLEAHESFYDFEYARLSAEGEMRWVSISGCPIFDEAGAFRGYHGAGRDVTARKRAEELLRLEHGVTRCLAESDRAPDTMRAIMRAVCETGHWACGSYWHVDAAAGVLRFAESWSIDDPAIARFIEASRTLAFAPGESLAGLTWQSAQPVWSTDVQHDPRMRHAPLWLGCGIQGAILFPLLAEGEVVGVMAFGTRALRKPNARLLQAFTVIGSQIGQYLRRKSGEQALAASEQRFRGLTALSSDWYWEQDAELRFTFLSDAFGRKTGLDMATHLGRRRWDIPALNLTGADWAAHQAQLARHEDFREFEIERARSDGSSAWMSVSGAPVFDEAGCFRGYRGVARDITAKKRRNQMIDLDQAVTRSLAAATGPTEGLRAVLRAVCESEQWDCGTFWRLDEATGEMRVAEQAIVSELPEVREFAADARGRTHASGHGLVGAVWQSGRPAWVADLSADERTTCRELVEKTGVRGALLVPVTLRGSIAGMLDFNCRHIRVPDARLLHALGTIADHVGQFLQRADAEASLRESEERFRSLTALSSDYFWAQDAGHRFTRLEGRCWTGEQQRELASQLLGKTPWEAEMTVEGGWDTHRATLAAQRPFHDVVIRRATPDGALAIHSVSGEPVFDAEGAFAGYRGVGRDITAERRAADRLRLEHAVAGLLASTDKVSDGLRGTIRAVCEAEGWDCGRYFAVDAREGVLRYSDGWGTDDPVVARFLERSHGMLMRPAEGLAGEVWQTGWPLWVADVGADARVYARALLREYGAHAALVLPVLAGTRIVGVIAFSCRGVREPDARLAKALGVICSQLGQFLQRKSAEQALRESEQRFRSLTELSSDYYWEQDEQYRFVKRLGAGLQAPGFPEEDVTGKTHWELDSPNMSAEDWARHRADLEARREFRDLVLARRGADGELHYYSISGQPLFDLAGRFRGYRGVAKEVSDRMRAEEMVRRTNDSLEQSVRARTAELEYANHELESYNYSISHDLRQPLSAIAGFADMLVDQLDEQAGALAKACAHEIEANAERMDQMIESLRRLADSVRGTLCVTQVDVAALVKCVLHDLSASAPFKADIRIGELPRVEGDPVLLRQVWANLIGNALKYSRNNAAPVVEIRGERREGGVEYTVRDNGVGFDMRDAARLFSTFQRLPSAAAFEGHGIGLAIVQRVVRRHGGTITAEAAPGKGATFRLTLPDRPAQ
jgi:PAS domain S-box-containing protein